jgi:xanthine dehydrogenase YagS FAD-binding subunit
MKPFAYARPSDPTEAMELVSRTAGAMFLAGGTNLVDLMKLGVARPTLLVDVSALGYDAIAATADGGVRIGGAVRNSDLAANVLIRERYPVLAQALVAGASGQVRNMATVAGNLLQRTRCAYFQEIATPCNKRRPGSGCAARAGDHRNLAILGGADACIATHSSDMAVALTALEAHVVVRTPDGRQRLAIDDLYVPPDIDPTRETVLEPGWLIEAVELPAPPDTSASAYRKVRDRASFAFGLASVAAVVGVSDGIVARIRLGLGAVAPKPWRAARAEAALTGVVPTEAAVTAAIDDELSVATLLPRNAFKRPLMRRLVVRTLLELTDR